MSAIGTKRTSSVIACDGRTAGIALVLRQVDFAYPAASRAEPRGVTGMMKPVLRNLCIAATTAVIVASAFSSQAETATVEEGSFLAGRVVSSGGEALAGIPVRARRDGGNFAVVVYTDGSGAYAFPEWSDLAPGAHTVSITLADFEPVVREGTGLLEGETTHVEFTLEPREPSLADATASEIVAALPGTDEQKLLFTQCSNCHSLQKALQTPRTKEGWVSVIRLMMGERNATRNSPR